MTILDFLIAVNGIAQLFASDGQFLGLLSSNQYDQNSISNLNSFYGSPYGLYSIRNEYGIYGGAFGLYSPYNNYCLNPPVVFYQNQPVLIISKAVNNVFIQNNLQIIDPDFLLGTYIQLSNSGIIPFS